MNICILNTAKQGGGAEAMSRALYEGMKQLDDCNMYFVSGNGPLEDKNCIFPNARAKDISEIRLKIKMIFRKNVFLHLCRGELRHERYACKWLISFIKDNKIDILHINNIHGTFLGIRDIEVLSKYCKIVWTQHDMWTMTGHCAYAFDCRKWIEGDCSNCPRPELICPIKGNIAGRSLSDKRRYFTNNNITFVAISDWMLNNHQQSVLKGENVKLIKNGIDTTVFVQKNRDEIRAKYEIVQNDFVVLFVANGVDSPFKGIDVLVEALTQIDSKKRKKITLLISGHVSDKSIFSQLDGYRLLYTDYLSSQDEMANVYSAADVFIAPSRAEAFSLVVVESMACGTPVIGSTAGGIPELITEETGWVFVNGDSSDLKEKITMTQLEFELGELAWKRVACRKRAERYDRRICLNKYRDLYLEVLR